MTSRHPGNDDTTGAQMRQRKAGDNRNVALILVAVAAVFLGGAVGVALLVSYGPF